MDAPVDGRRGGFTLVEMIVSLGLVALIAVGSLGVLGATHSGGALGATPTAVGAVRLSKDHTAAGVYLQALHEFLTGVSSAGLPPGTYCGGPGCAPLPSFPPAWSQAPLPPSTPDQLGRARVVVRIERWYWDATSSGGYCAVGSSGCGAQATGEALTWAVSTVTWEFRGSVRALTLARVVP